MDPRLGWIMALTAAVASAQLSGGSCPLNTCGEKAICKISNGKPQCECPEGHFGNPWNRCTPECEQDSDCSATKFCDKFICQPVCSRNSCVSGAVCSICEHRPVCACPPGFVGSSTTRCSPECRSHTQCPSNMVCRYPRCVDPCVNTCGQNASCEVENHKVMCRCPKGMIGSPFESCRPMTPEDVCNPNPCGENAECTAYKDKKGFLLASCSCPPGFYGEPLTECKKGDCINHDDCFADRICQRSQCVNPCKDSTCPANYSCQVRSHRIHCTPKRTRWQPY